MSKDLLRLQAIKMRKGGNSVKQIAQMLGIAKSSASLWVRDVILTVEQLEKLRKREISGREKGRLIGALRQKQARLERMREACEVGILEFSNLTERELFITGLAIYAGEGNKKTRAVRVCNSDPNIISFMVFWLKKFFRLTNDRLRCFVGINEIHREREDVVKKYWSNITGLPLSVFQKTSFKKSINKKIYENFADHYGTLDIRVLQSAPIYYKIMGQIHGLFQVRQGSSVAVAAVS